MRYVSTRGGQPCGFLQAVSRGRAPNAGVYLPQDWPQLTLDDIAAAGRRPLAETIEWLLLRFAGLELDPELAFTATREALTAFAHPAVAPLREFDANLWLLDLACGPTMTAADAEMQVLARLIGRSAIDRGRSLTLLLATDGQDGPAAVEAFRERAGVGLVVLFPADGVTPAQRRAMTDAAALNVRAVEVEADADGCRLLAAAAMADERLNADLRLGSLGPENMGRVVIAAAVLLSAASRLGAPDRDVVIAAPEGEQSYAFGAYALAEMGLGAEPLVLAEGAAGRLGAALHGSHRYERTPGESPPIPGPLWSAGFERLYFTAAEGHVVETARAGQAYSDAGFIDLSPSVRHRLDRLVRPVPVEAGEVQGTIMSALNVAGERLDAKTATVIAALRRSTGAVNGTAICPLLAHQAWLSPTDEFERPADLPPQLRRSAGPSRCDRLPADVKSLGAYLRAFAGLSRAA